MKKQERIERIETGVRNFDLLLNGGIPAGSVILLGGTPGAGKTTLAHQICFKNATPEAPCVIFQTLSEPAPKTIKYMSQFSYFDAKKIGTSVQMVDLGSILRTKGLEEASKLVIENIKRNRPRFVIIDSFKVFEDLSGNREDLRKFSYEIGIQLMAWECTAFLIGEYTREELAMKPISSVVDGIIMLKTDPASTEKKRFFEIMKMRGTKHYLERFIFDITDDGIEIFAPSLTVSNHIYAKNVKKAKPLSFALPSFDKKISGRLPNGASVLLTGSTGTGKTTFCLESIFRSAKELGEKSLYFSTERTTNDLIRSARSFGWDFEPLIKKGLVEFVTFPMQFYSVESKMDFIQHKIEAFGPRRVVIDSLSVLLHRIRNEHSAREKTFQLATMVKNAEALGLFTHDRPYGEKSLSRFGTEESALDGVVIFACSETSSNRDRFIEIYKMRDCEHHKAQMPMEITSKGITVGQ